MTTADAEAGSRSGTQRGGECSREFGDNGIAPPASSSVGFSPTELAALRRAYGNGARGVVLVLLQNERRVLTLHLPAAASELSLVRALRPVLLRGRAIRVDGWMLARRARLRAPVPLAETTTGRTPQQASIVLMAQERVHRSDGLLWERQIISPLAPVDIVTFYESPQVSATDRATLMLNELLTR